MLTSLRQQTAAIVVSGLILSNVIGYFLYSYDRQESLLLADAFDVVERAAGVSRLLRDLPGTWEDDIVRAADSRAFRVWASDAPPVDTSLTEDEDQLAGYFRTLTPRIAGNSLRVWFQPRPPGDLSLPVRPEWETPPLPRQDSSTWYLVIAIEHGNGHWLNFLSHVTPSRLNLSTIFTLNLLLASAGLGAVALWLVARVTSPLHRMTEAASELGRNLRAKPLPEGGPQEVAVAARAFNRMQRRLIRHVEGRTTLLAAISHDLRTPITQMRLRTELMPPSEEQRKNLVALDEMNTIIGTFLDYSRASNTGEATSRVDLSSLVESICDDFSDEGHQVTCETSAPVILQCRRVAIKRVLVNIIGNAVNYGGSARVNLAEIGSEAVVTIQDSGPGIPDDRLADVFEPFFRLEPSRAEKGDGIGLGLSIALMIVEDHGGTISLENKPQGGLLVEVRLPLAVS